MFACGDFNINMADLDKPYSKTFQSFMTTHSLTQPISHPTCYSGASNSILDLFLVSPNVPISKYKFKSYFSYRSHVTRVADSYSSLGFPCSGVPQGSILGPTFFSAFINDLPSVLPPDSTVLFADDATIFIISDNLPSLNSTLQLNLDFANL